MGTRRLSKAGLERLDGAMGGYVERGKVPGLVALVSRRGETHAFAAGKRTARDGSVRRDTIFRISSMTKPVTAAAAMVLVEDGKLTLDEPVDRLLPELAGRRVLRRWDGPLEYTVPARRPISVLDLLTFRMGIGIPMAMPDSTPIQREMSRLRLGQGPPAPSTPPPADEWVSGLGKLPLMSQPGEKWSYSTGADVLGVLIARAAGSTFERFLEERIFRPLGMRDTGFMVPASKMGRFGDAYWATPETGKLRVYDEAVGGQWSRQPAFPSGAAGLVSTVDDYLAFALMLMAKGKGARGRVLSERSVEAMTTNQLTEAQRAASSIVPGFFDTHGWGFGVAVTVARGDPREPVGSYGWNGGLGSIWQSDPRKGLVAILMTDLAWSSPQPPPVCRDFLAAAHRAAA